MVFVDWNLKQVGCLRWVWFWLDCSQMVNGMGTVLNTPLLYVQ